ncbi:MAG: hypothetical protein ACREM8_06300 [Vulcanimicrobiaceae bacterium]
MEEIVRIPSPAPAPQALVHDGEHLWMGSWETQRIYGLDPHQGTVFEEWAAPGKPVGGTAVGDDLRFVCSEAADSRFIRRLVPGHGFKHEAIPCPEDTGSFLAFDGERLWLSQRYNKRVLELDADYRVVRTIEIGEQIIGLSWFDDRLYLSTWLGKDRGGCRIAYIEPGLTTPPVIFATEVPFVAVSLARDGDRLWTNDFKANAIVAFALPP